MADGDRRALRERLSALEKHELVDLATELLTTYVVEALDPLARGGSADADLVGEETFAGLLRRLKADRPADPILQRFIVTGEHIQVRTPMGNVDVTEYQRPNAPARAPAQPPPTERNDSIYNRELHRGQEPGRPPPPAPARTPAAPAAQTAPEKKDERKDGERFRMIELD